MRKTWRPVCIKSGVKFRHLILKIHEMKIGKSWQYQYTASLSVRHLSNNTTVTNILRFISHLNFSENRRYLRATVSFFEQALINLLHFQINLISFTLNNAYRHFLFKVTLTAYKRPRRCDIFNSSLFLISTVFKSTKLICESQYVVFFYFFFFNYDVFTGQLDCEDRIGFTS